MSMLDPIPNDRPLLLESPKPWLDGGMPAYAGIRQGRWRYIEYDQGRELYDVGSDPWQLRNRIADPTLRQTRADLAATLDELRDCAGATCRQ